MNSTRFFITFNDDLSRWERIILTLLIQVGKIRDQALIRIFPKNARRYYKTLTRFPFVALCDSFWMFLPQDFEIFFSELGQEKALRGLVL